MWSRRPPSAGAPPGAGAVQGQVVGAAVEVDVVGIGAPLDLVAHDVDPEALRRGQIGDEQRHVTDAKSGGRVSSVIPRLPAARHLGDELHRLQRTADVMGDDLEERLAAVAVHVGRQRCLAAAAESGVAASATSAARTAGTHWPSAARAGDANRAAPIGIPPERDVRRGPAGIAGRRRRPRSVSTHGAEPQPARATPARRPAGARRWLPSPPGDRGRRSASRRRWLRPGGARRACRPARRRRRRAPSAPRRSRAARGCRSRRSAPRSSARRPGVRVGRPCPPRRGRARRKAALALARAARERGEPPRLAPEQRHDPIGLAVAHGAQDDRGCSQGRHVARGQVAIPPIKQRRSSLVQVGASKLAGALKRARRDRRSAPRRRSRPRGPPEAQAFTRLRRAAEQQRQRDRRDQAPG